MTGFRIVGVLCPVDNMAAANAAAYSLSGVEADRQTFSEDAVLSRDGGLWCYAHGPLSEASFAKLPDLADALGGIFFETSGDFWEQVGAMGFGLVVE